MATYNHQEIEKKWQERWAEEGAGHVENDARAEEAARYHLTMFPYPSGSGLHVGHVESYAAVDILTRYARMNGEHVLFPIGFDAFGLPAENYAVMSGVHPSETTAQAIETFTRQMKSLGLSFDYDRVISTAAPSYYKWTQWLFLQFLKNDLAYRASAPVNWCTGCNTVLANEQVVDGACERCGSTVEQKELEQWFFRVTRYADRLLEGLEELDWPERIKAMQRHWIGKKEGAEIDFAAVVQSTEDDEHIEAREAVIRAFTTRPDTLFGVSYLVLAPEHPLVDTLTRPEFRDSVVAYRDQARQKSALERTDLQKHKTGVAIGAVAKHPLTGEEIPIWIGDYVLMSVGSGAVMGVPAHDDRDFAFATEYGFDIKQVITSYEQDERIESLNGPYTKPGILVNSGAFDGLTSGEAKAKIVHALEAEGRGQFATTYRIHDWLVSRQRYWGAPIPIIWCEACGAVPVPEEDLPVLLPEDVDFTPTGESPLSTSESFHAVACPECGRDARRESDTMDTFVDSSWYHYRYCDPDNSEAFATADAIEYWCPPDIYVGGAEHAVMHLLFARFFGYAMHDLGLLPFAEPFPKLRNQGLILGPDGEKMSKSRGNVINPDDVVREYGADAIRMYEMFMGPLEDAKPWDAKGIVGVRRFLDKVWRLKDKLGDAQGDQITRMLHKTIKQVGEDIEALKFNTAIAQMMTCINTMQEAQVVPRRAFHEFVKLLAPFAPHLAEELWHELGHERSVFESGWPEYDASLVVDQLVEVAIQVNGKLRGTMEIAPDLGKDAAAERAAAMENVAKHLEGQEVKNVIYVPGRMINFVV